MKMTSGSTIEPLVVSPREACALLGIGNTRLYRLLGDKVLDSYKDGKSRRIPMAAIKSYIERRIAESMGRRGRGRPRKADAQPKAATEACAG
jgi:excisionase family DNA binding protein